LLAVVRKLVACYGVLVQLVTRETFLADFCTVGVNPALLFLLAFVVRIQGVPLETFCALVVNSIVSDTLRIFDVTLTAIEQEGLVIALGLTSPFGIAAKREALNTDAIGIQKILEVTTRADVAVEFQHITVNISNFHRFETSSANSHQSIIAKITIKLIFGGDTTVNVKLVADVVLVVKLALTGVAGTWDLVR